MTVKYKNKQDALQTLLEIQDWLDESNFDHSELNDLQLVIKIKSKTFQWNYHGVTDQLWYSSPISGAHHFDYTEKKWCSTRNHQDLWSLIRNEIN